MRLACALIAAAGGVLAVVSLPLVLASLFAFDAPGAMGQPSAWAMFLLFFSCPFLAAASAGVALLNVGLGARRLLWVALALLAVPAGTCAMVGWSMFGPTLRRPACPAPAARAPLAIRDVRCP